MAQSISITSGTGKFSGYLALPEGGSGPGLVIAQEIFGINHVMKAVADKFAEEGYVVLVPDLFWRIEPGIELGYSEEDWQKAFECYQAFDVNKGVEDIQAAVTALRGRGECDGKVGVVGFCLGGLLAYLSACRTDCDAAVGYYGVGIEEKLDEAKNITCPTVLHFAEKDEFVPREAFAKISGALKDHEHISIYDYPGADHAFAREAEDHYHRPSALIAHTRTLTCLKSVMGPHYNLEQLWDRHTAAEFEMRDAGATMKTMVGDCYVNHMPTMTGGVGQKELHRFYKYHFIPKLPEDTALIPISRTVGADRVVDEMIFSFTHDTEIDWMLPGIPPTGKKVEIPLVAVVCFRGGKLYHEHIYWDQASVLVQLGLLDPKGLPIAGVETAKKAVDETLPSNQLMAKWKTSEGKN
ncbi:MAG: dienelactone hydrolase family protein [Proteobacteria bacterium]|nr:dienelactone hydrolase family protein [Pseudomonadota bacterium]